MVRSFLPVCLALTLSAGGTAQAQQSLFEQSPADPTTTFVQPEAAPAAKPARTRRARPKGPQPTRSLTVVNARSTALASLEVSGENRVVRWDKPLKPDAKAIVKLPAFKGCTVSVRATFEGEQPGPPGDVDICREKNLRLTD